MRVVRFHRLFDEDGMGRAAKLSICHDTMLCGGCNLVLRILFGSLSHQRVACPHVYAGQ